MPLERYITQIDREGTNRTPRSVQTAEAFMLYMHSTEYVTPGKILADTKSALNRFPHIPNTPFPPREDSRLMVYADPNEQTLELCDFATETDWRTHFFIFKPTPHSTSPFAVDTILSIERNGTHYYPYATIFEESEVWQINYRDNEVAYGKEGATYAGKDKHFLGSYTGSIVMRDVLSPNPSFDIQLFARLQERVMQDEEFFSPGSAKYYDTVDLQTLLQVSDEGLDLRKLSSFVDDPYHNKLRRLIQWRNHSQGGFTLTQDTDPSWSFYLNMEYFLNLSRWRQNMQIEAWTNYMQSIQQPDSRLPLPDLSNLRSFCHSFTHTNFNIHVLPHSMPYIPAPSDDPMI